MIKKIVFFFVLLCSLQIEAQVTIGSSEQPDKDALLDLKQGSSGVSNKGFLMARVALTSTTSPLPLTSFVSGMIVFNTATVEDVVPGLYYSDGYRWILLKPSDHIEIPTEPWLVAGTDEEATLDNEDIYHTGSVIIGRSGNVDQTAALEVYSDSKGFLMPRLTEVQRDAIASPTESLMIWNMDEGCFNFFAQNQWKSMCGDLGNSSATISPSDCGNIKIEGFYQVGVSMNASNYLSVTVQVSNPGSIKIEGKTNNGFYFQKTGTVATAGTYTYDLLAVGTPNTAGMTDIQMYINDELITPACTPTKNVEPASVAFTFDCLSVKADDLTKGVASTNKTMTIDVNITTAGVFSFNTNTVSGVQYSATNVSLSTGRQSVVLYANGGIPTVSGIIDFTLTGTGIQGANCTVPVNVIQTEADLMIDCLTTSLKGTYVLYVPMTTSNYAEFTIQFNSTGTWSASSNTVDGLYFEGSGNVTKVGQQKIRVYAQGTPINTTGKKTFTITINGQECTSVVSVLIPPKKVLSVGNPSGNITSALTNTKNFGPEGTVQIHGIKVYNGGSNPSASNLAKLINDNQIEIIIAGWDFDLSDDAAAVIADFINNKKGYFFQVQAQDQQTFLKRILDRTYGTNVTFTEDEFNIYAAKLPNDDNVFLNGVFGDCRNRYIRVDDNSSWIGLVPSSETPPLKSIMQLPERNGYPVRNLFTYADGFFMIPDWGTLAYTSSTYGSNNPIGVSTSSMRGDIWDGVAFQSNFTLVEGMVVDWLFFGNIMSYIIDYTEKYTNETYQVTAP